MLAETKSASTLTLADPSPELFALFHAAPAVSGVTVSPDTACRVPAVRAAVFAIAEALGQIQARIFSTGEDAAEATDHPAYGLLHDAANEWTSASALREQLVFDALRHGNGYAAITRDGDGNPVEMHRLQPERMTGLIDPATLEPYFQFSPLQGSLTIYNFRDVFHLKAPSINGVYGDSPVRECAEAIASAIVMERMQNGLFSNGAKPSGMLVTAKALGQEAANKISSSWRLAHGGRNSGGTAILEGDLKYQQLALSSVDAQFLELRTFGVSEIARIFRISPILLGELGRATFANAEETCRQFVTFTLSPWITRFQNEAALKLFAPEDRINFRVELDTDDLVVPDLASRATAYSSMIAARVLNPNEARRLEGLPAYAGGNEFINPNITAQENISLG